MNETVKNRRRSFLIVTAVGVTIGLLIYLRVRPKVFAESHSPHPRGGFIRVVETPTSFLDALLFRYNPYYRFEYHWPGDYLWSAASFSGESYNANRASISWTSGSTATVFLDDIPQFQLQNRQWSAHK